MPPTDGDLQATLVRSRHLLDPGALDEIARFVTSQRNADGGFRGRDPKSDLYYTYFATECLRALGRQPLTPSTSNYVLGFRDGNQLDFVHLCCLVHCLACIAEEGTPCPPIDPILAKLEAYRTPDGGYSAKARTARTGTGPAHMEGVEAGTDHGTADHGTAYAAYLAWLAYNRWHRSMPRPDGVARCLASLKAANGGYANALHSQTGLVTATAAAAILLHELHQAGTDPASSDPASSATDATTAGTGKGPKQNPAGTGTSGTGTDPEQSLGNWLLAHNTQKGGLKAAAGSPLADLLSSATGLFALRVLGEDIAHIGPSCISFVQSLWQNDGGFSSQCLDSVTDCEYTYYGLLALGCLEDYA